MIYFSERNKFEEKSERSVNDQFNNIVDHSACGSLNVKKSLVKKEKDQIKNQATFKQIKAYDPKVTSGQITIFCFVLAIFCFSFGSHVYYESQKLTEIIIDYTNCRNSLDNNSLACEDQLANSLPCQCIIEFQVENDIKPNVFVYYQIANFYQNHRLYMQSVDRKQLLGYDSADCKNYHNWDETAKKPIAPCGKIANSMFNDSFAITNLSFNQTVPLLKTGLTFQMDKLYNYHNPEPTSDLKEAFKKYSKPQNWPKPPYELDEKDIHNNGYRNEQFIVWMRNAAIPLFRKLYARINHNHSNYTNGLPKGHYNLTILYNYPTKSLNGKKSFVIANTSIYGGKNDPFIIVIFVTGLLYLMISIFQLFLYIYFQRSIYSKFNLYLQ